VQLLPRVDTPKLCEANWRKVTVALTIGIAYFAVDYFLDVNSLYQDAIDRLSNAYGREEYE